MLQETINSDLNVSYFKHMKAKIFFSFERVINIWKCLSSGVVDSNNLDSFKNSLGKYLETNSSCHCSCMNNEHIYSMQSVI